MGDAAKELENERLLNQGPNKRLFKINSGMGWVSDKILFSKKVQTVKIFPGDVVVRHARPLHAAPAGWPDLCGFESVVITPDMVGQKIAVFVGEEIKAGRDVMRPDQKKMQKLIEMFGGVYRIIRG